MPKLKRSRSLLTGGIEPCVICSVRRREKSQMSIGTWVFGTHHEPGIRLYIRELTNVGTPIVCYIDFATS